MTRTFPRSGATRPKSLRGMREALLGDLRRRAATAQEAAARFDKAIALQPPSARARALYGLLLVDSDELGQGSYPCCSKPRIHQRLAGAVSRRYWHHSNRDDHRRLRTPARPRGPPGARRLSSPRGQDSPTPSPSSARLDAREDGNSDASASRTIRRARTVSPGRADYIVLESFILMRRGEFAGHAPATRAAEQSGFLTRGSQQCPGDPRSSRAPRTERRRLSREARRPALDNAARWGE